MNSAFTAFLSALTVDNLKHSVRKNALHLAALKAADSMRLMEQRAIQLAWKKWLQEGFDRSVCAQLALRQQILEPKRCSSLQGYNLAVAEWEKDQEKLLACGGELPGVQEMLIAYVRLLPEQVKHYAQQR